MINKTRGSAGANRQAAFKKRPLTITFTPEEISRYYKARVPELQQLPGRAWWRGPCPIHNGARDSFSVNPKTGWWHCFSECDRSGSIFDLEQELSRASRTTAVVNVLRIMGRL